MHKNQKIIMNADAYGNNSSGFRIKSGMTFSTLSFSGEHSSSQSSSCLTRGSIRQEYRLAQSGRSMVEMLGTLAIIGVLSVGGIAGYSYGMDKYRANTIMNDVNLRAVDLIAQVNRGGDLSLSEWPTKTASDYSIGLETNGATTSGGILVSGVKQSICEKLADDLLPTGVKLQIDGTDYVSGACGETNNMTFYYDAVVGTAQNGGETPDEGPTGEQCGSSVCGTCQKCENESCVAVADYETKCTVDGQSGWCVSGTCEPETTCNCSEGQYCADTNEDSSTPHPSGTCKDLDFREVDIDGTTYYLSNSTISWWDAVSACEALGNKRLLSLYDLVEDFDSTDERSCELPYVALRDTLYEKGWGNSGEIAIWTSTLSHYGSWAAYSVNTYGSCIINFSEERNGEGSYRPAYAVCR